MPAEQIPTANRATNSPMTDLDRTDCPVARALDLLGDRWTLLIVRDLVLDGPRRFSDLSRTIAGSSPAILSNRLKRLEQAGLIERRFYSQHPPRAEYLLTRKGKSLEPVLGALRNFGETLPEQPR
jgi:DNA-binding HxlR family transcriptional regulator